MRSIGAELGADFNAATSFDHTHYDLIVPFTTAQEREERCAKAAQILADFAGGALFLEEDVRLGWCFCVFLCILCVCVCVCVCVGVYLLWKKEEKNAKIEKK